MFFYFEQFFLPFDATQDTLHISTPVVTAKRHLESFYFFAEEVQAQNTH
jgi:hypothetical protein